MNIEFNEFEVAAYYQARVPGLKKQGGEFRGPCPVHHGKDLNFAVNPKTGQACCHSQCGRGWDIIGLEQELTGEPFAKAKESVFEIVHKIEVPKQKRGEFDCAYNYTDADGNLLYQAVRFKNPKGFTQRQPDGKGDWIWNLSGVERVPYRLPGVTKSDFCFIVEGEKDADNLAKLGLVATCNNEGAGKFREELAHWFEGKRVCILPDNDDPGRMHAQKVAQLLHGKAKSIKIVELPNLPDKGDVSDFIAAGGTIADLRALYTDAPLYLPETAPDPEDKYIRSLREEIEAAGGMDGFWNMALQGGVPTPFPNLTKALGGGLLPGEVYAIAGRTGSGKTSLGLQFAIHAMRKHLGVVMFSMEMTWRTVFQRLIAIEARVDMNEFRYLQERNELPDDMVRALAKQTAEFIDAPLWISTKSRITPAYLLQEATRLKDKLPKVDLLIVDHMQLMGADGGTKNEYEKFTEISRALKQTAKNLNLPVLVMAQVHRKEDYAELEIDDIRGSGAIEEDTAGIMLLYEDKEDAKRAKCTGMYEKGPVQVWLKLGKSRFGSQGLYSPLLHFKKYTRFDLADTVHEEAPQHEETEMFM